jgi:hypothetical protein
MFWTLPARPHHRARTQKRLPRPILALEHLEDRLVPDASFYQLANGPFLQDWSTTPITNDNDWSNVPSIIGYNGAGLAPTAGTDPQTVLADGTDTAVTVLSNQSDPTSLAPAGIAEFTGLSKPTVALAADSTDQAPFLLLNLDTTQMRNVHINFSLRDLVLPASTVAEPFALQYRIGTSGNFANLATGFVSDATDGANPGNLVTPVSVTLPGDTYDQPQVQVRILTTNPTDTARWIGVDDIKVTGTAAPLTFVVDSSNSSLNLSGDVGGSSIQQQGSGSLTTHYSGTIAAVWDHAASTISFVPAGSDAVAANSGNWQPSAGGGSGSAAANYGGQATVVIVTAQAAIRELHASLATGTPLSLGGSGPYTFASTQTFSVTHGFIDYNAGIFGTGRADISGNSAINASSTSGTLEDLGGGAYRLTMPIDVTLTATFSGQTMHLHIQGTIVANATSPVDPSLPVVDLNGSNPGADNLAGFVQGSGAVVVAPNATVTRTPPANLTSAFVTLTNRPDGSAESLAANVSGTSLTASYDASMGRLTISGVGTLSDYQTVLQTVTYNNTAGASSIHTANRLIEFTVSDGSNNSPIRTAVVTIAAPRAALVNNLPPAQATPVGTPLTFSSAGGNAISISDPNANAAPIVQVMLSVSNGTLTLANTSGLTIVAGDNGSATITIRGTLADINAALDGLVYTPNPGFSGSDALTILSDDLADTDATGTVHYQSTLGTVLISVQ